MSRQTLSLATARKQSLNLLWRISIGLNFMVLAMEVALFGFRLRLENEVLAQAVSPWMGPAALLYLIIQVGAVVVTDKVTRGGAIWDVLFSILVTGYLVATLIYGNLVDIGGSLWPWDWTYNVSLFTADFIRNFGTAMVGELLLILTMYFRYFQMQTEISNDPQ